MGHAVRRCWDVEEPRSSAVVGENSEQADAKTLLLFFFCKYVYIKKEKRIIKSFVFLCGGSR